MTALKILFVPIVEKNETKILHPTNLINKVFLVIILFMSEILWNSYSTIISFPQTSLHIMNVQWHVLWMWVSNYDNWYYFDYCSFIMFSDHQLYLENYDMIFWISQDCSLAQCCNHASIFFSLAIPRIFLGWGWFLTGNTGKQHSGVRTFCAYICWKRGKATSPDFY